MRSFKIQVAFFLEINVPPTRHRWLGIRSWTHRHISHNPFGISWPYVFANDTNYGLKQKFADWPLCSPVRPWLDNYWQLASRWRQTYLTLLPRSKEVVFEFFKLAGRDLSGNSGVCSAEWSVVVVGMITLVQKPHPNSKKSYLLDSRHAEKGKTLNKSVKMLRFEPMLGAKIVTAGCQTWDLHSAKWSTSITKQSQFHRGWHIFDKNRSLYAAHSRRIARETYTEKLKWWAEKQETYSVAYTRQDNL